MPFVDNYDTQSAVELLRQSIDYNGWCVAAALVQDWLLAALPPVKAYKPAHPAP